MTKVPRDAAGRPSAIRNNNDLEGQAMKRLVLLSGGQDSTTCLFAALALGGEVSAIGFNYGQSHAVELEAAAKIAAAAGVPYEVIDVRGLLAPSSLIEHTDHRAASWLDPSLPASFTPGRNLLFLTVAASHATKIGARQIWTGVCQTDYSGYPDCRRDTIDALEAAFTLGMGGGEFKIITPLMHLTKAETWRLARELGCLDVIVQDTVTDYNGDATMNPWGKGTEDNPASALRAKGYREAVANGWLP